MGKNGTTLAVLHGPGVVGTQWSEFVQKMFTEELPEECRDMNLDLISESVSNLGEEDVCNINSCDYKMLLLDTEVLKILKDTTSVFRQCELMEMQQEQVIVLLLGNEDDMSFNQDARITLSKLKDNEAYNIIQAKNPEQIFFDVMTALSPLYVVPHPNIMSCEDKDQQLTLISNKPFPAGQDVEYVIEFTLGRQSRETSASLFNPYTLLLSNSGHQPGLANVKIFACTSNTDTQNDVPEVTRTQIGDDLKVWFQSDLDKVYSILDSQSNPMAFLCQGMDDGRDQNRTVEERIDKLLTESFKKYVPDNKLSVVFGNAQSFGDEQDGNRPEYVPTLLHFSAMYGLRDLTAALLQCPGAVHAYGTPNCDGDFPTNLAEKSGHWELRDFMHTYMEVAAMVHNDYGDRNNMQTSQIMSSMVYGQYLSFPTDVGIQEDIYVAIDSGVGSIVTPPGYVRMHPAAPSASGSLPQSVDYDFMIKRMLESDVDDPEKDYEELDIPGPPLPEGRRSSYAPSDQTVPPPPPPRDDRSARGSLEPRDNMPMLFLPTIHSNSSPAQEELISLQKKVKNGEVTINQAVFRFKEWERKHKERAASFLYQQENLQRIRNSLMRGRQERKLRGESTSIKISDPMVAGSSTFDQVLLKTRKEVIDNPNGGPTRRLPGKFPSIKRNADTGPSDYSHTGEETSFKNFRSSIKSRSFSRVSLPHDRTGRPSRPSLDSKSNSSSPRSSARSTSSDPTSFYPPQVPPTRAFHPPPNKLLASTGEDVRPPMQNSPTYEHHGGRRVVQQLAMTADYSAPPLPPRDDKSRRGEPGLSGPELPPRSRIYR